MNKLIQELEKLDEYRIYAVEFTKYFDPSTSVPSYYMKTSLIDSKSSNKDDITFVSMKLNNNKDLNKGFEPFYETYNLEYYGDISYIKSFDEYTNYLKTTLKVTMLLIYYHG